MAFWREKNANLFFEKGEVWSPNKEELEQELILKLKQKCEKITLLYDEGARKNFFKNDKKSKKAIDNGASEDKVLQVLSTRIVVDCFQLARDLCSFYKLDYESILAEPEPKEIKNAEELQNDIFQIVIALQKSGGNKSIIESIVEKSKMLSKFCGLKVIDVENERAIVEEKEGNFFNGKYVRI